MEQHLMYLLLPKYISEYSLLFQKTGPGSILVVKKAKECDNELKDPDDPQPSV